MQTTTISFPDSLAREVEKQVEVGKFASRSKFFRAAVKSYLSVQKGELTWDVLAAPFRAYAKKSRMSENNILRAVDKVRHAPKSR